MADGNSRMLFWVRLLHTLIYVINGTACFFVLFAGVTGRVDIWLWVAIALVAIEAVILFANGIKCPMSPLAERYGAKTTDVLYDTFIPERLTRHTFWFFSLVVLLGLALFALRGIGFIV